jgi:hypothetical protein
MGHGQRLHGIEKRLHVRHAQHSGSRERGIVNFVASGQGSRVGSRGAGALGVAPGLDHDHRLHPCRSPGGGHEFSGMGDGFDIEQDRFGAEIIGQVIEHVTEIDISHVADGYKMGKTDAARCGPIQDRGLNRP